MNPERKSTEFERTIDERLRNPDWEGMIAANVIRKQSQFMRRRKLYALSGVAATILLVFGFWLGQLNIAPGPETILLTDADDWTVVIDPGLSDSAEFADDFNAGEIGPDDIDPYLTLAVFDD